MLRQIFTKHQKRETHRNQHNHFCTISYSSKIHANQPTFNRNVLLYDPIRNKLLLIHLLWDDLHGENLYRGLTQWSKIVFISICVPWSWDTLDSRNFSASLAIWMSFGLENCTKTLTTKCGMSPPTMIPSKHTQNKLVSAIWKKALHSNNIFTKISFLIRFPWYLWAQKEDVYYQ